MLKVRSMFWGQTEINFWLLAAIFCLVLFSGFFTCSETALFSLSRLDQLRLKEHPRASCRLAVNLLRTPRRLLATILIGNEFSDILCSSMAAVLFIGLFGDKGELIAYPLMSGVLFLGGDLIPKVLGFRQRERLACLLAPVLRVFVFLFTPVRALMLAFTNVFLRTLGIQPPEQRTISDEEILHLVEEGYRAGLLGEHERQFIYGLLDSEETPVSAIMTPRREIFALEDAPISDEIILCIKERGFSRIPIYRENLDQLLGILHVKDLLRWRLEKKAKHLADLVRPPFFVPEMMRVRRLLEEFQRQRLKFALVVDEYGVIVGLVTLEDVLEELFGEIYDEFDRKEAPIEKIAEGVYRLSPRLRVDEFNRLVGADLPSEEFETMGGLVLYLFGELPREGMSREAYGFRFTAERVKGAHILSIRVERIS